MLLAFDFVRWWYCYGWLDLIRGFLERVRGLADFFSFSSILRTLFSPFKQISSNQHTSDAISARISDFFDRGLSRVIGFVVRLGILIFGGAATIVVIVFSALFSLLWPLIPLTPIACIVLACMGVAL